VLNLGASPCKSARLGWRPTSPPFNLPQPGRADQPRRGQSRAGRFRKESGQIPKKSSAGHDPVASPTQIRDESGDGLCQLPEQGAMVGRLVGVGVEPSNSAAAQFRAVDADAHVGANQIGDSAQVMSERTGRVAGMG